MDKDDFRAYLILTSYWAVQFAEKLAGEQLPYDFVYDVELNQSADEGAGEEFVCYPEDEGKVHLQQSAEEVLALLVRDGRVPVWIDISVKSVTKDLTTLRLLCAGRFTNQKEQMYYSKRGQGPFGVKSPNLPLSRYRIFTKNAKFCQRLRQFLKSKFYRKSPWGYNSTKI